MSTLVIALAMVSALATNAQKLLTRSARPLCVPVARTLQQKTQGLQGVRHPIPMAFVFNPPLQVSFWMKNTPARLTGVWVTPRGIVSGYWHGTPYSLTPHSSPGLVHLVLEYPRGYRVPPRGSSVRLDAPCKLPAGKL